jgi:lysophospholipase L1-like esterase
MMAMKQSGNLAQLRNIVASLWVVSRGSIRSRRAEIWEGAFLREASNGAGYAPPQHPSRIVFAGDSITKSWPLKELLSDHDVCNAGVNGNLLSQIRERWRDDVLARDAGVVHLLGGTNNITHGYSQEFMQRDVVRIAKLAEVSRMRMVLGLLPPLRGHRARLNHRVRDFNLWLRIFSEEKGLAVADYYSPLVDANGDLKADLTDTLPDGKLDTVHLNRAAYQLMTMVALQALAPAAGAR